MFIRSSAKEKKTMAKYWNKIHQLTPPGFFYFYFFTRNFFKARARTRTHRMQNGYYHCYHSSLSATRWVHNWMYTLKKHTHMHTHLLPHISLQKNLPWEFNISVQISSSTMWYKLSGWQKCERCDTNSWKIPASLMDLCPCGRSQQVATSHFGSSLSRLTYSVSGAHPLHIHTRRRKNKHTFQQFPWQDFNCQREIFSDTDLRFSS